MCKGSLISEEFFTLVQSSKNLRNRYQTSLQTKIEDSDLAHSFEEKMRSKVKILSEIKQATVLKYHSDEFASKIVKNIINP